MVIDDTKMRMARPRIDHFLVKFTRQAQTLLVGFLITGGIRGSGIILFGTVCGTHQMEYGIVTLTQTLGIRSGHLGYLLPLFGFDIGRDVQSTSVADDQHGFRTDLCQRHELILESQLRLKDGALTLIIELAVRRQIVPAANAEKRRNLRDGEYLISHPGEILDNLYQCGSLACTWSACQDYLLDLRHRPRCSIRQEP